MAGQLFSVAVPIELDELPNRPPDRPLRPGRAGWSAISRQRTVMAAGLLAFGLVLLAAVPGLSALSDAPELAATVMCTAVALGAAVPLAIRLPPVAWGLVAAAVLGYGLVIPARLSDGPLGGIEVVGLLVLSWVAGQVGLQTRLAVGLPALAGWLLVVFLGLGGDAPLTMVAIGWWVIGTIARSRRRLQDRLDERVAELADERDRYAAEAVQLERARIARDLHDIVAHCMTVIVIQARAGQQLLEDDPASVAETWAAITASVAEAGTDLDALTGIAEPGPDRPLSSSLLNTLIDRAERGGSPVKLIVDGRPEELPRPLGVIAHRTLSESITNVLRYAPGAAVRIELDCRRSLRLTVANAASPAPELAGLGSGHGLAGLRTRLAEFGLVLDCGPDAGGGWRVAVRPA